MLESQMMDACAEEELDNMPLSELKKWETAAEMPAGTGSTGSKVRRAPLLFGKDDTDYMRNKQTKRAAGQIVSDDEDETFGNFWGSPGAASHSWSTPTRQNDKRRFAALDAKSEEEVRNDARAAANAIYAKEPSASPAKSEGTPCRRPATGAEEAFLHDDAAAELHFTEGCIAACDDHMHEKKRESQLADEVAADLEAEEDRWSISS